MTNKKKKYYIITVFRCGALCLTVQILVSNCSLFDNNKYEKELPLKITKKEPVILFTDIDKLLDGEADRIILDTIILLIDNAKTGSDVYISIYKIGDSNLLEALIKASNRGVNVNIQYDWSLRDADSSQRNRTFEILSNSAVNLILLDNRIGIDTLSTSAINHNKYILISELETGEKNIVLQTSSNLITASTRKIQDAIIFADERIFTAYKDNWYSVLMHLDDNNILYQHTYQEIDIDDLSILFTPYRDDMLNSDGIANALRNIVNPQKAKINIAMSLWSIRRPLLIDALSWLENQGTDITILVKSN